MDCAYSSAIKRIIIKSAAIEKNVSVNCCTSQMVHALDIFFKINFQPAKKPLIFANSCFFSSKQRTIFWGKCYVRAYGYLDWQ